MQTPNILIVEDEVVTRTTLKSLFEAEGYNVFEAEDGEQMHDHGHQSAGQKRPYPGPRSA